VQQVLQQVHNKSTSRTLRNKRSVERVIIICPIACSLYHHQVSYRRRKRQKSLKDGTDKPKLKVNMQSVSDDDVRKRLLEKLCFELMAKGVFRLEDVTSSGRAFQVFGPATGKSWLGLPTVDRLIGGTRRRFVLVERSDRLPARRRTGTSGMHCCRDIIASNVSGLVGHVNIRLVGYYAVFYSCSIILLTPTRYLDLFSRY